LMSIQDLDKRASFHWSRTCCKDTDYNVIYLLDGVIRKMFNICGVGK